MRYSGWHVVRQGLTGNAGWGRQWREPEPKAAYDVVVIGGGGHVGLPLAMVLVRPEHDVFGPAEHNGTFRGNTHAFVTARVAIEKFWSDTAFEADLARRADLIQTRLTELADLVPGRISKVPGVLNTDTHISFRSYSKRDTDAAFAIGLEDA